MKSLLFVLGITLCASRSISQGIYDASAEDEWHLVARCQQYCGETGRRCEELPFTCGHCVRGFIEKDGECLPLNIPDTKSSSQGSIGVAPDAEIDNIVAAVRSAPNSVPESADAKPVSDLGSLDRRRDGEPPPPSTTTEEPPSAPTAAPQQGGPQEGNKIVPDTITKDAIFIAVVAGCSVAGLVGLIVAGVCWYKLQKNVKAASDVDYPAYGVTGPSNGKEKVGSPGDRKLAQSAQMYHYQHQKQQMIAMEKANNDMTKDGSEVDTDEENEEGDYTVFECPGLAPTGEMEVKNPLFNEETPVTPSGGDSSRQ